MDEIKINKGLTVRFGSEEISYTKYKTVVLEIKNDRHTAHS